jgi:hypothetical protein
MERTPKIESMHANALRSLGFKPSRVTSPEIARVTSAMVEQLQVPEVPVVQPNAQSLYFVSIGGLTIAVDERGDRWETNAAVDLTRLTQLGFADESEDIKSLLKKLVPPPQKN